MSEPRRLDALLASTGRWSRKEAKDLIRAGRVSAAGAVLRRPEEKCALETVEVDGVPVACPKYVYLMLYKPTGILSATEDRRQATVLDLLPPHLQRIGLYPVGRLDKDSEGLLLLTNDGPLGHRLLAPGKHVAKTYLAEVEGTLDVSDAEAFRQGMVLEDGTRLLPASLEILSQTRCRVTVEEGKYRQIRRMLAQRGKPVTALKRLTMGPITLDETLSPGAWRPLTEEELARLPASD
ncbi:MAG: pseudouridine synthase [Oscillospiraceae bacterium]|nr:pseudouridine synthase [Oscillospiraceae bacterium]